MVEKSNFDPEENWLNTGAYRAQVHDKKTVRHIGAKGGATCHLSTTRRKSSGPTTTPSRPPRPDQFVYLSPPQFGGAREPVQFSIVSPGAATDTSEPQWKKLAQQDLAIMVSALREIGGRRAYCRYDGGHDEGFAWLDSIELRDGARINTDAVAQRLYDIQVHHRLRAADLFRGPEGFSDLEQLKDHIRHWLCNEWAATLLGDSYGTGEYSMYGAFTVDLEACTIADDPHAHPVVENIAIAT